MTKDELAELKKRWMPTAEIAVMETHYKGCIFDSHACAINALIAHVETMDAALREIVFAHEGAHRSSFGLPPLGTEWTRDELIAALIAIQRLANKARLK